MLGLAVALATALGSPPPARATGPRASLAAAASGEQALAIMRRYEGSTPGAMVEPKAASIAFHVRGAAPRLAATRLDELRAERAA